jgi:hypothetical protein
LSLLVTFSSDFDFCLCVDLLLERLVRLLVVVALVLDPEGVTTGGNLTSSLPSTVAGFKRRKVAADSGPERVKGAGGSKK